MSRVAEQASLLAFRAGWLLVRRMPERLAFAAFDGAAAAVHRKGGKGVERMRSNYAKVRPELSEPELENLVAEGLRSYFRYWCEVFRLPVMTQADIDERVRPRDEGPLREHLAAGRPAVMFLAHLGNWDLGGAWSTTRLAPVTTVAERLKPEGVFDQFLAYRQGLGMTILPLTGGPDPFRALLTALKQGQFVALLADRDLSQRGVVVQLCGHAAKFAPGPAALALATGAVLQPVSVTYERRDGAPGAANPAPRRRRRRTGARPAYGTVVRFHAPVTAPVEGTTRQKIEAMTQQCADVLGEVIRERTEDWHMMQRVFVDDLDPR